MKMIFLIFFKNCVNELSISEIFAKRLDENAFIDDEIRDFREGVGATLPIFSRTARKNLKSSAHELGIKSAAPLKNTKFETSAERLCVP